MLGSPELWIIIILALVFLGGPALARELSRLVRETRKAVEEDEEQGKGIQAEIKDVVDTTRKEIKGIEAEARQVLDEIVMGPADPLRVFVCSMQDELEPERIAIEERLRHLGKEAGLTRPILFERLPASPDTTAEEAWRQAVERCDVVVMIVAEKVSAPVLREHQLAVENKKPIFYFVKSAQERSDAAEKFLKDVADKCKWAEFQTPDELAAQVVAALVADLLENYRQRRLAYADVLALLALGERLKLDRQTLDHAREQARQEQSWERQPWEPQLVYIPDGRFWMGTSDSRIADLNRQGHTDWYKDEAPQTRLYLKGYWIGKYPVTNAQYKRFVEATDHKRPFHWEGGAIPTGRDDHPVVRVTWDDAVAYCRWLAQVTGKPYHLPSEAEWEKAARGPDGREYPWGNMFDASKCNMYESGVGTTTSVGHYSPRGDSPYGCADMTGNVWEWTRSLYKPYPYRVDDGREDVSPRDDRVLRGGSFNLNGRLVRAAYRNHDLPNSDLVWFNYGFRCGCGAAFPISP